MADTLSLNDQWRAQAQAVVNKIGRGTIDNILYFENGTASTAHHAAVRGILPQPWRVGHILQSKTTIDAVQEMHRQAGDGVTSFWLDHSMLVDLQQIASEANRMNYTLFSDFIPNTALPALRAPIFIPYEQWQTSTPAQRIAQLLSLLVAKFRVPQTHINDFMITIKSSDLCVSIPPSMQVFAAAAEVRALRLCWQRVTDAADASPKPLQILCCGFAAQLDCDHIEDAIIRNTLHALSGIMMQAETIFLHPHEAENADAIRLARNTLLILKHESCLGDVQDVAGGAYGLEAESIKIAHEAWDMFRAMEARE